MNKISAPSYLALSLLLAACSTTNQTSTQSASNLIQKQSVISTSNESYPAKKVAQVTLYTKDKTPHTAYRVIGVASVANTNLFGIKRNELAMSDMLKSLAASIGGDGVIDIHEDKDNMQANVIAFQKILI